MAAATRQPTTQVSDDESCWGDYWLPAVLEAIGGFEGKVNGVRINAEHGRVATATIMRPGYDDEWRVLPHHGTVWLSEALPFGVPRGIQAITVDIKEGEFVIVNCRYAPIDTPIDAMIAALKVNEDDRD